MLTRVAPWTLRASLLLLAGCSAGAPGDAPRPLEPERTSVTAAALSGPVSRSQVIANAQQWVTAQLAY